MNYEKIVFLFILCLVKCQVKAHYLTEYNPIPENIVGASFTGLYEDAFGQGQDEFPWLEEEVKNVEESGRGQRADSYLSDALRLGERTVRQKTACMWTGCHKIPLGKESSCSNGTVLESYKICEPRGSKNLNVQCCP